MSSYGGEVLVAHGPLQKVQTNLYHVNDVDDLLDLVKVGLVRLDDAAVGKVSITRLIDVREHEDQRRHHKSVDYLAGNQRVPQLAKGAIRVYVVPVNLDFVVDDG